jgi:hypothetical protein
MTRRVLRGVGIAVTGLALLYAVAFVMGAPA